MERIRGLGMIPNRITSWEVSSPVLLLCYCECKETERRGRLGMSTHRNVVYRQDVPVHRLTLRRYPHFFFEARPPYFFKIRVRKLRTLNYFTRYKSINKYTRAK